MSSLDDIVRDLKEYEDFIEPYEDASKTVQVWLDTLDKDFKRKYNHNPIHGIKCRTKSLRSIAGKLKTKKLDSSFESAMNNLTDIAGIRVICYYISDVYYIINILKQKNDIIVIKETDYIKNPKPNGYRSYHIVLGITIYQSNGKHYYPVEIQVRTLAMDFWASMEHTICYKKERDDKEELSKELQTYSEILNTMEQSMEKFYDIK